MTGADDYPLRGGERVHGGTYRPGRYRPRVEQKAVAEGPPGYRL
jgi:hypothetical protein